MAGGGTAPYSPFGFASVSSQRTDWNTHAMNVEDRQKAPPVYVCVFNLKHEWAFRGREFTYISTALGGLTTPPSWSQLPLSECSWHWSHSPEPWQWKSLLSFHLAQKNLQKMNVNRLRRAGWNKIKMGMKGFVWFSCDESFYRVKLGQHVPTRYRIEYCHLLFW